MVDGLITAREAAIMLAVHPVTLAKWRKAGKGPPYVRLEDCIRYDPLVVAQYIKSQQIGT